MEKLAKHLPVLLSALTILAGLAFTYGQLTERVDGVIVRQDRMEATLTKIEDKLDLRLGLQNHSSVTP